MSRKGKVFWQAAVLVTALLFAGFAQGATRAVRAQDMTVARGETNTVFISFDTLGDEYAVDFMLCFDTNQLAFVSAARGSSVSNMVPTPGYTPNFNGATNGQVSVLISLDIRTSQTWPAGTQNLMEFRFRALPGSGSTNTVVSVCAAEVSNPFGDVLGATLLNANVSVVGTCSYNFGATNASFTDAAGSGVINVIADAGCAWGATNTNSWITFPGSSIGSGNGAVAFDVAQNTSSLPRSGVITIAGKSFVVTQSGFVCSYLLFVTDATHDFGSETNSIDLLTDDQCPWTVSTTNSWITLLEGTNNLGSGVFTYSVAANGTTLMRTGIIVAANQTVTVVQLGAPCSYELSPLIATFGANSSTGQLSVTTMSGCSWQAFASEDWISISSAIQNNSGTLNYVLEANPTVNARSGFIFVGDQALEVNQSGVNCSLALSVSNQVHGSGVATNSVDVTAPDGCPWNVATTNNWITIESPTANSGVGVATYSLAENSSVAERVGYIAIGDQTLVITQQAVVCVYNTDVAQRRHSFSAQDAPVYVTAQAACPWFVENTAPWISIQSGASGVGDGTVVYHIEANNTPFSRTATITVAGRQLTLTQDGFPCPYGIAPGGTNFSANAASGSVAVTTLAGCPIDASTPNSWITITATNSNSVSYTVQANTTTNARNGIIFIGDQLFTISQQAGLNCTYTLATNGVSLSTAAQNSSVAVTTPANCPWTVSNSVAWITILSATNNTNSGVVNFSVQTNATVFARSGTITIADQTFTVTQAGTSCSLALQSSNWVHRSISETGLVGVISIAGCSWGVTNTNSWITINSAAGDGSGYVGYSVAANASPDPRSGVLNIGGAPFSITQMGTGCTYRLSTTNRIQGNGGNSNNVVTLTVTGSGCSWSVINTNPWLTIVSNSSGTATAVIGYGFPKNTNGALRAGVINVAGEILTITQWGTNCGFTVLPVGRNHSNAPEAGSVAVNAASSTCAWNVVNTNSWITIPAASMAGTNNGSVSYTVSTNTSGQPRVGVFTVSGAPFTIIQAGTPCSFNLSSSSTNVNASGANVSLSVTTGGGCAWSAVNSNSWISITTSLSNTNSGTVSFTIDENPTGLSRNGVITIAGQSFTITQTAAPCAFALATSGANYSYGPTNGSITVNTLVGCAWGVTNTNSWISFGTTNNTSSGSLSYTVLTNSSVLSRTGIVSVMDQTFTIVQAGAPCGYTLGTNLVTHGYGVEQGSIAVATANTCVWPVSTATPWINILSGPAGTNTGLLTYSVTTNATVFARTGTITIAGQTVTVIQAGTPCTFALSQTNVNTIFRPSTSTVSVATSPGCAWTATSVDSWLTVLSTNNNVVTYAVATNGGALRSGTINIAGIPFRVTQAGSLRSVRAIDMQVSRGETNRVIIALESTGVENALGFTVCFDTNQLSFVRAEGGTAATNLAANLNVNNSAAAIGQLGVSFALNGGQVLPAGSNALVEVFFRAKTGSTFTNTTVSLCDAFLEREINDVNGSVLAASYFSANVAILGTCTFTVTPESMSFRANGGSDSFDVQAHPLCAWTASSGAAWIHVTPANATGTAPLNIDVDFNPNATPRSGTVTIAGQTITITQDAQPCSYVLTSSTVSHGFGAESGSVHLATLAGCPWQVTTANSWITITSPTNGTSSTDVSYVLSSNTVGYARTGVVQIADQSFTIIQDGAPCSFSLIGTTNKLHGYVSETGSITVATLAGCDWTISNTNAWIIFVGGTNGSGSNVLNYAIGYNPNGVARTGTVFIASRPFTIRQPSNPCPVTLSTSNANVTASWVTNTVNVTPSGSCAWTIANTNPWISTSTSGGTGNGNFSYIVQPNPSAAIRVGIVTVSGRELVITQAAATCLFSLNPPSWNHGPGAESGAISLTTAANCDWTIQNTNSWVSFSTATAGTGGATLLYNLSANPSSTTRSGSIFIGSQIFTISQSGASCSYALNLPGTNFSYLAQTGSVSVTTPNGCVWPASTTNSWIILPTTNFTNSSTVSFTVASNNTALTRSGGITIGNQFFAVTQTGVPCVFTISPTNVSAGFSPSTNIVTVNAAAGCDWPASSSGVAWVTINQPTNTAGNGTITFTIGANPSASPRSTTISIAGRLVTISQGGAPCVFTFSATNVTHTSVAQDGTNSFTVPDGCPWTAQTTNDWLIILSAASGTGSSQVWYGVDDNFSSLSRTGSLQVAGQTIKIVQTGANCSFNLSSTTATFDSNPATNTLTVSTLTGCKWGAQSLDSWITILVGSTNSGNGTVRFAVATNYMSTGRTGTIMVAGQPFTVSQQGAVCRYLFTPATDTLTAGNVTGLVRVVTTGDCAWVVVKTNDWIAIKANPAGTNSLTIRYTLSTNTSPNPRVGHLMVADQVFSVTQMGAPCGYSLSSTGRIHGSLLETGQVAVVTVTECTWDIINANSWIQFQSQTNGQGTAVITYTVQPNPNSVDRTGSFIVGDQTYTITQLGSECSYTLASYTVSHGGLSETGTVSVTTPQGCTWSVTETNTWISLLSPTQQTNNGVISYSVAINTSGATRIGYIKAATQTLIVTQATVNCVFTVSPTNYNHGFEAETNNISVTTSNICPWTVSKSTNWINIISSTNQTGSATISYYVTANPSATPRTGTVVVAGTTVTVRQAGLVCSYNVNPTVRAHGYLADTNTVTVTCPTLCTWAVINTNSWITIQTATNNTGPGTMRYAIGTNPNASQRTGYITVDGQTLSVVQSGRPFIVASNKTVQCNTAWTFDPPISSGSCPSPGFSVVELSTTTNAGCGSTYTAKRVWDAIDNCNVEMMVTQVVTVVALGPIITCAQDKTVECGAPWTFNAPTAIDGCSGANLNASIRVVSTLTNNVGMCGSSYAVTRTWEVADGCSNKTSCSQTVRILDTTPPIATCASNKTVECGTAWNFDAPTATDLCGGTNVTIRIQSTATNTTGCGLIATRIWEILDLCSNRTTCTQTVSAVDTTPPSMTCPSTKTVECGSAWAFDLPSSSDTCSGVTLTVLATSTNTSASCGSGFTATRTWQAIDGCGNANFCSQTVVVVDTTPPVVSTVTDKTVEFGAVWDFDTPTASDACSGTNVTTRIAGTSTNRTGFCGSTFSATRVWEFLDGCSNKVTRLQTVTVRDTTPPVITCAPNKTVNCQGAWTFDAPTAVDLPSGVAATISVVSTITNGTCGSNFTVIRTWRATDACSNSVTCSQTVLGRSLVSVAGTVYVPTNYPAARTDKRVAGATIIAPTNGTTAVDGSYTCIFDVTTNACLTPTDPQGGTPSDGVTTIDLSLVRRHILSVAPLDTPYKLLAADVDGSGSISTLDLTAMRRVILGATNRFPRGVWRFVPNNYNFTNSQAPWNAPTNRTYTNLWSDTNGQDFAAIKLGDVNNSWGAGASDLSGPASKSAKAAKPVVTFTVSNENALPGTSVVVRVSADGFRRVTSVQGTLAWDPHVIRFIGTEQFGLAGLSSTSFGTTMASNGAVSFSWDDPSAAGTTVADGTTVFALRFEVVGSLGSNSRVTIGDSIAVREAGVDFTPATFQTIDGQLNVSDPAAATIGYNSNLGSTRSLTIPTISGRNYVLEYTDVLPSTNWAALPAVIGDGSIKVLSDPNPATTQRFYRVRIE